MISILVTTFNRLEKLKRCLGSIQSQTYQDFEIIIIDDASTDGTQDWIETLSDGRIRYFRNEVNLGSVHGDRTHIKRFIHELAQGEYFLYVCDDDHLANETILGRLLEPFETYPNVSMVVGSQVSVFDSGSVFHKDIYPKPMMTSSQFLEHFSAHPIECNIIVGATLFDLEKFRLSGAMAEDGGSWQSGPEMIMAPACLGNVGYINEPCVIVEVTPGNASFRGTQESHFLEMVASVKRAFKVQNGQYYDDIKLKCIENISKAYLANAESIRIDGRLTMCTPENVAKPVTQELVDSVMGGI